MNMNRWFFVYSTGWKISRGWCIVVFMAKRATGIEKGKTSRSKKTKKRLEIKRAMLAERASKKRK